MCPSFTINLYSFATEVVFEEKEKEESQRASIV